MNKVIKEHYPAASLPDELRDGINPGGHVTVTVIEEETPPDEVMTLEEIFAARKPPYRTKADIDAEIGRSRDEWDG